MSSIDATSGTSSSSSTPSNPSANLNEQDFLQLLVAQLQYQDPMDPTDDQSFIQEQAQFSTVEGINNMQSTLTTMTTGQKMSNADSLIGMNVEYTGSDGSVESGVVSSASDSNGTVTVQVGSDQVDPSSILQVSFPSSSSPAGSSGSTGSTSTTGSTTGGSGTGG